MSVNLNSQGRSAKLKTHKHQRRRHAGDGFSVLFELVSRLHTQLSHTAPNCVCSITIQKTISGLPYAHKIRDKLPISTCTYYSVLFLSGVAARPAAVRSWSGPVN